MVKVLEVVLLIILAVFAISTVAVLGYKWIDFLCNLLKLD